VGVGIIEAPAYQGEDIRSAGEFQEFIKGYGVAIGVEGSVGIGGPVLMQGFLDDTVDKAGTAIGEFDLYAVDYTMAELTIELCGGILRGVCQDSEAEIIEHIILLPLQVPARRGLLFPGVKGHGCR